MKRRAALGCVLFSALLASALSGCNSTLDSLGTDGSSNAGSVGMLDTLSPVKAPDNYFQLLLFKQPDEITAKISSAFHQLFYGGTDQVIFSEDGDLASIKDVLHGNVRTEGMALAMLIAVELDPLVEPKVDKQKQVFDPLWRYAKTQMQVRSGPAQGYFNSYCGEGNAGDPGTACYDPYGMQQFVLALVLANARWGSSAEMPYASDALALLDVLQNKEVENRSVMTDGGGDTVTSAFDTTTHLVREEPTVAAAGFHRSALEMPAAYELWAQATGNQFWSDAADAARAHLVLASGGTAGLWPIRSYFDGSPVPDSPAPSFTGQAYRTQLNLALDVLWGAADSAAVAKRTAVADHVLGFFTAQATASQGFDKYGSIFTLDGTPIETKPAQALISVNGALAIAASLNVDRTAFVQAVWDQAIPSGQTRYYDGLLYMMSLLVLSGQLHVQWS